MSKITGNAGQVNFNNQGQAQAAPAAQNVNVNNVAENQHARAQEANDFSTGKKPASDEAKAEKKKKVQEMMMKMTFSRGKAAMDKIVADQKEADAELEEESAMYEG